MKHPQFQAAEKVFYVCCLWLTNGDLPLVFLLLTALLASAVNAITPGEGTLLSLFISFLVHTEESFQSNMGFNG